MNHVFAVLALVAAILVWFGMQRWSGRGGESACDACAQPSCEARDVPLKRPDPQIGNARAALGRPEARA